MNVTTLKKTEVTVREIGGAMAPIWNKYYKDASAIMVNMFVFSTHFCLYNLLVFKASLNPTNLLTVELS